MRKLEALALGAVLLAVPVGTSWAAPASAASWKGVEEPFGFEANRGQFEGPARFVGRASGVTVSLDPAEAVLDLGRPHPGAPPVVVRMALVGASRTPRIEGREALPGLRHYLRGAPEQWVKDVRSYARVEYAGVYPGIDLVFRGNEERAVEYDFVVAPGSDPRRIRMAFAGSEGLRVDAAGDLVLQTAAGPLRQHRPRLYQEVLGKRVEVAGGFVLQGPGQVGFEVGAYDARRPLVIDPTLSFSTYRGGCSGYQGIQDVFVDDVGNSYVTGYYPGDCDGAPPNVFVTKYSSTGVLVFHTTLGGSFNDEGRGVAADAAGNVYLTGSTSSNACCLPFPIVNAIQPLNAGGTDAFIVKLNPTGQTILYSSFYGGSGEDRGADVALDASGRIYITGTTTSPNFPVVRAAQPVLAGGKDAFVAVLNPAGSAVVFSTYLGGGADDKAARLVVSATHGTFVAGTTASPDFPVRSTSPGGPLQPRFGGGASDAFLARFTSAGVLADATFLGGTGKDEAYGVAMIASGYSYVMGGTNSPDFPTANPLQPGLSFPPEADAFLAKLAPGFSSLTYSTYLGVGANVTCPYPSAVTDAPCGGVAVGRDGSAFVTARNVFVTKVNPAGTARLYTFNGFGGHAIGLGPRSLFAYVAGRTASFLYPTVHAQDATHDWYESELGWLAKLADAVNPNAQFEETDPRIAYTGNWQVDSSPDNSGGSALRTDTAGAKAVITVTGAGVQVIGRRDPAAGILKVTLGTNANIQNASFDAYASPAEARSVLFSFSGAQGTYTVTLEATGTHGTRSSGSSIWIDGINVLN